jgi:hypothetical protein
LRERSRENAVFSFFLVCLFQGAATFTHISSDEIYSPSSAKSLWLADDDELNEILLTTLLFFIRRIHFNRATHPSMRPGCVPTCVCRWPVCCETCAPGVKSKHFQQDETRP